MKIQSLKQRCCILTCTTLCIVFSSFSFAKNDCFNTTILIEQNALNLLECSLYVDSTRLYYTYEVSQEIDAVSSQKIEQYMMQREGVLYCKINLEEKKIILEVTPNSDRQLMLQLVRFAERLYVNYHD